MLHRLLVIIVIVGVSLVGEEGLVFKSTFDVYNTTPDFAKGSDKSSGIDKDLQLRMSPGIASLKSNAVALNGRERIVYDVVDNFDPRQGTVSLWVKPENWAPENQHFQVFFQVRETDFVFLIYTQMRMPLLTFYIKIKEQVYMAEKNISDWKTGSWYKLDAVWNCNEMRLYVNGRCDTPSQIKRLGASFILPEPLQKGKITLNEYEWWNVKKEYVTVFDDLKIYQRCLLPEEIHAAYEKIVPSLEIAALSSPLVTIPRIQPRIRLDGKIEPAEWANASSIPICTHLPTANYRPQSEAYAFLQADSDTLFIAIQANRPATKAIRGENDSELWFEDSFEAHFYGKDGKHRQIIVSPLATVYDALNGRKEWDSGVKVAAFRFEEGWSAEIALPLSALGGVSPGETIVGNFAYTEYFHHPIFHSWGILPSQKSYGDKEVCGRLRFDDAALAFTFDDHSDYESGNILFYPELKKGAGDIHFTVKDESGKILSVEQIASGIPFQKKLSPGRYIFHLQARNTQQTTLYSLEFPEIVKEMLTLSLECYPSRQIFMAQINVYDAKSLGGMLVMTDQAEEAILAKIPFQVVQKRAEVAIPFPKEMKENRDYVIRAQLEGDRFSAKQRIHIPSLQEVEASTEADVSVPSPWTPVVVAGKDIRVLDRIYSFADSPFPEKIVSRGQVVLESSPELLLNGSSFEWSSIQIIPVGQERVEIRASGRAGTISILWEGELWFDGMYRFSIELTPSEPLEISSLILQWKVPVAAARYVMSPGYQRWEGDSLRLRYTPRENGSLLWLTGVENGLAWWCESDANFVNAPDEKQIFLQRTGGQVSVSVAIISQVCHLQRKAAYTMMFQATPPKRPAKNWQDVNIGYGHPRTTLHVNYEYINNPKAPTAIDSLTSMRTFDDAAMARFTKHLKEKRNARLLVYTMPVHVGNNQSEFLFFEREWTLTPPITWSSKDGDGKGITIYPFCPMTDAKNLYAARTEKFLAVHTDIGGIYYDICHVVSCDNTLHGCGGLDAFGKPFSKSIALGLRNYLLRIYKLHRKYDANLLNHAHNYFFPFVHDFGDSWIPGEQHIWDVGKNPQYFYFEGISQEEYQCAYNADIRGVGIYEIIQLNRAAEFVPELKDRKDEILGEQYALHAIAPALVHNLGIHPGTWGGKVVGTWRRIKDEIKLGEADFHPYWRSAAVYSETAEILCSWYSWKDNSPYSRMLVIANSGRETQRLSLKIDWEALELRKEKIQLRDLWKQQYLSLDELRTMLLPGNNFILIGISEKASR